MSVKIYYTKDARKLPETQRNQIVELRFGLDWYNGFDYPEINRESMASTHDQVLELGLTEVDFEDIFMNLQGEAMGPLLADQINFAGGGHTSMSVGDIIELEDGSLHIVDSVGFTKLS